MGCYSGVVDMSDTFKKLVDEEQARQGYSIEQIEARVKELKHKAVESLDRSITWDHVAERMRSQGNDPDDCNLGAVLCAVRKMMRKAISDLELLE